MIGPFQLRRCILFLHVGADILRMEQKPASLEPLDLQFDKHQKQMASPFPASQ